jgi:hypothetical protein
VRYSFSRSLLFFLSLILSAATFVVFAGQATAATLELSWADNSSDELGFHVERKLGVAGTYNVIATTSANVTSYADSSLADNTTYCYRVNAFNDAGDSPYSPELCGTTRAVTARPPPQQITLTVALGKTTTSSGIANGTVTSSPAGINCGSTCSASFDSGTLVTLTATPATGSTFGGWAGRGCSSGAVTMTAAKTCTATFKPQHSQTTFILSISKKGTGSGTVTSSSAGINCGATCSAPYSGTIVTLRATAGADSTFTGWSVKDCRTGIVTMNESINCTATFQSISVQLKTKFGVFRPESGEWFLDRNGNGHWDGCGIDQCISSFGQSGDLPVVGSWSGNGLTNIGTFTPSTGSWRLDTNGDGVLDCAVDTCADSFGQAGDFPITRELSDGKGSIVGTFTPQTVTTFNQRKVVKRGRWNFDVNGNSALDGCDVDECTTFRTVGELPVVGDWDGTGTQEIGVFLPRKGSWHLDRNGNGKWDGCEKDRCFGRFGAEGDLPIVGDWDGTGSVRVGVFRPSTGMWYLDINGNGKLDSCTVDACFGPFGQPGDLPVVGKW